MIQIIVGAVIVIIMILACIFVNDTKKKYGTCCGKGCAGCPIIEEEYHKQKERREKLRKDMKEEK